MWLHWTAVGLSLHRQTRTVILCNTLTALPGLRMFQALHRLHFEGCDGLTALSSSRPLLALSTLEVRSCHTLVVFLDLGVFSELQCFHLQLAYLNREVLLFLVSAEPGHFIHWFRSHPYLVPCLDDIELPGNDFDLRIRSTCPWPVILSQRPNFL